MPLSNSEVVQQDARNRALRTLLQGLAFDVAAAVVLILFTTVSAAQSWGDLEWTLIAFSVAKSAAISALSYLMRTVFDRSVSDVVAPPAESGE
jgi:hypothetical protein